MGVCVLSPVASSVPAPPCRRLPWCRLVTSIPYAAVFPQCRKRRVLPPCFVPAMLPVPPSRLRLSLGSAVISSWAATSHRYQTVNSFCSANRKQQAGNNEQQHCSLLFALCSLLTVPCSLLWPWLLELIYFFGVCFMALIKHFILVHSVFKYAGRFVSVSGLEEAVELTKLNRIKSEIIGHWLYCFTNHLIGVQLQAIGFWYSL